MSSGWLSGQLTVTSISALVSILPCFASVWIARYARKNMKATTCRPLNSMTVKGSNGSSRSQLLNPSMGLPLERRHHENFGQIGGHVEQVGRRVIENVVLRLYQNRTNQTCKRRVHGNRHATAHDLHRGFHGSRVETVEAGDREQHQDEPNDRSQ